MAGGGMTMQQAQMAAQEAELAFMTEFYNKYALAVLPRVQPQLPAESTVARCLLAHRSFVLVRWGTAASWTCATRSA